MNKSVKLLCPKCGEVLSVETNEELKKEYPYVCLSCDENFYSVEAVVCED